MRGILLMFAAGCSFHPTYSPDAAGSPDGTDGPGPIDVPPGKLSVVHVPAAITDVFAATASVTFANVIIDTRSGANAPVCSVPLPTGAQLLTTAQDGSGPELALLEVGSLSITGTLRVVGSRPLVIIARDTIDAVTIDASAVKNQPGVGGYGPELGPGAGGAGGVVAQEDAGGGGGGYGTAGGAGQTSGVATGAAGVAYGTNDLVTLDGGSGGGASAPACATISAGAGGGAIQLYAGTRITITGSILANGGGGGGGQQCAGVGASGAGGGAGGAIYLQSPMVLGTGLLLAQGGGGGGGANVFDQQYGSDGENGSQAIAAAQGGAATGTGIMGESNVGGNGGFRDAVPTSLVALSGGNSGNGGGGGGAVGRIVIKGASSVTVGASPLAVSVP